MKINTEKFVQCDNGKQFYHQLKRYENDNWICMESSLSQKWFKVSKVE
jgi:hypothetical protein